MASSITSGGGGSAAMSADTDAMRATAQTLTEVAQAAKGERLHPVQGVGTHARAVEDAASVMRGTWAAAFTTWGDTLSTFSSSVTHAADAMEGTESFATRMWDGVKSVFS